MRQNNFDNFDEYIQFFSHHKKFFLYLFLIIYNPLVIILNIMQP